MHSSPSRLHSALAGVVLLLSLLFAGPLAAEPLDSRFTYQGELRQSGTPANGVFDFQFQPFGTLSGGIAVAPALLLENVAVSNGVFSVELDFGMATFVGEKVWLEVGVRQGTSTGGFTGLLPRQALTAAPYALHAEMVAANSVGSAELINGSVGSADIDNNQVQRRVSGSCTLGAAITSINSSGTVTCSPPPSPVVFKVRSQGFAVKPTLGETTIDVDLWDIVEIDTANAFNTTTKRFVVPSTGYYYLQTTVKHSNTVSTSTRWRIYFSVGDDLYHSQTTTGSGTKINVSGIYRLTAGTEVYVRLRNFTAGSNAMVDGFGSWFEGYKISD